MKYYQIIQTDEIYNKDDIALYYSPKNFNATIYLDRETPIKKNPFITFYYVKNIYDTKYIEDEFGKIIILLKKDAKEIYATNDEGYILSDNFISHPYLCDEDEEINKVTNKIGTIIVKENYCSNAMFTRILRLQDNQLEIYNHDVFDITFFDGGIIENSLNNRLIVNIDESINIDKYEKVDSTDIENTIYYMLITNNNYNIINKAKINMHIKELINIIKTKYGQINKVIKINEKGVSEISGLVCSITLLIETEKKLIIIATGLCD